MKKTNASRPALSLPIRLGILALTTLVSVLVCASYAAHQTGTDVVSYLGSLNLTKAYSKQNLDYALAEAKLRAGDRKGAAALAQNLPLKAGSEEFQNYSDLRGALIQAQLGAGEFPEALRMARDMAEPTQKVLWMQLEHQGRATMLTHVSALAEPERSTALSFLARQDASGGDTAAAERLVGQMAEPARGSVYPVLMSAYYKAGDIARALASLQRISAGKAREGAFLQLGQACAQAKDVASLKRVLALCPIADAPTASISVTTPVTSYQVSTRHQILQAATSQLPPATALELVRSYAHHETANAVLEPLCSRAYQQKDIPTFLGTLALLRTLSDKDAQIGYDNHVQQLFNGDLKRVPNPLPLALSVRQASTRCNLLTTLGEFWRRENNRAGLDQVLKQLRTEATPASQEAHDQLLGTLLINIKQTDLPQARQLAQQLLNPRERQSQLESLDVLAKRAALN